MKGNVLTQDNALTPRRIDPGTRIGHVHLKVADILEGASDHGVSEVLYLSDPDGNGVELYRDRPQEEWPRPADGSSGVAMYSRPIDLEGLLKEAPTDSQ